MVHTAIQQFVCRFSISKSIYSKYTYLSIASIPGTCLSFVLGVEPYKRTPFPVKTRVVWVPAINVYIYILPGSLTACPWTSAIPKGKDRLPTIIFQGRFVKLRGCIYEVFFSEDKNMKQRNIQNKGRKYFFNFLCQGGASLNPNWALI